MSSRPASTLTERLVAININPHQHGSQNSLTHGSGSKDSLSSTGDDTPYPMTSLSELEGTSRAGGLPQRVQPPAHTRTGSAGIIFTLWNTMMGSTLLVMPHIFHTTGWLLATIISIVVCSLATHTANLLLGHAKGLMADESSEICDLAALHLGRTAKWVTFFTGVFVLVGASCAMHAYSRTSLSHLVALAPDHGGFCTAAPHDLVDETQSPCEQAFNSGEVANLVYTVAMLPITLPLANLSSMRLLSRVGGVGVICFVVILGFAMVSAAVSAQDHGLAHARNGTSNLAHPESASIAFGIFSMSFFIHNALITIMRGAANPEKNPRDIGVAFFLVWICYVAMGVAANLFPPLGDLDALGSEDAANGLVSLPQPAKLASALVLARVAVLVQSVTVYPVLLYLVRSQLFSAIYFKTPYPGWLPVLLCSLVEVTITSAITYAKVPISDILKYVGSFGGLVCIFCLPAIVHGVVHWRQGTFTVLRLLQVSLICAFGIYSLAVQLVPTSSAN